MSKETRLHQAEERLQEIETQLEDLRIDRQLAKREIELLRGHASGPVGRRTDRIVAVLQQLGEATPSQVAAHLRLDEPDVADNTVRSTLDYLMKQDRVSRRGHGRYRVTDDV